MNRKTITKNFNALIRQIATLEKTHTDHLDEFDTKHFNMKRYHFECGAPACIAGHGSFLFGDGTYPTSCTTAKALDLNEDWARDFLFNPNFGDLYWDEAYRKDYLSLSEITTSMACTALKRVRDAGANYKKLSISDIWRGLREEQSS